MRKIITSGALFLSLLAVLAGCGGSETLVAKAGAFLGGALTSFGGTDGQDAAARSEARDITTSREYDFTPTGFVIGDGAVSATGDVSTPYGDGTGTLSVSQDVATISMDIVSNNPLVTDVNITGTFDLSQAQQAIDSPGATYVVEWTVSFTMGGEQFNLTAEQTLTGTDVTEV